MRPSRRFKWRLLAIAATIVYVSSLSAAPQFTAFTLVTTGTGVELSCVPLSPGGVSASSIGGAAQCDRIDSNVTLDTGAALAFAGPGHLGVSANSVGLGGSDLLESIAFAELQTTVIFTGPQGFTDVLAGMNIDFAGTLNAAQQSGSGATAEVQFFTELGTDVLTGVTEALIGDGQSFCTPQGNFSCGGVSFNGPLVTGVTMVPLNTPVLLTMELNAFLFARGPDASALAEFSNSLDLPLNGIVFNLPAGFTANDPDLFIVNNVFVPPAAVPEPATLALFGLGLAGLGLSRRRGSLAWRSVAVREVRSLARAELSIPNACARRGD